MPQDLLYTIVFDPPESSIQRGLGKMLALSVLKTGFAGKIVVFTNQAQPLFPAGRPNVEEIRIDTGDLKQLPLAEFACAFKFRARDFINKPTKYRRILYVDADCLAMSPLDALFDYEEELVWTSELKSSISDTVFRDYFTPEELVKYKHLPGSNAGIFSLRGDKFLEITQAVIDTYSRGPVVAPERAFWGDQPAWNRVAHLGGFTNRPFKAGQVQFPLIHDPNYKNYSQAGLVHFCGADITTKIRVQFATFAGRFYGEAAPLILDLMES